MKIVIQKFGGTSLQNREIRDKAAEHIVDAIEDGFSPVVVVSAMGRKGDPYATDTLLQSATTIFKNISSREKDLIMSCGELISAVVMVQTLKQKNIDAVALNGMQAGIITDDNYNQATIKKIVPDNILNVLNNNRIPVITGFQGISENGEITTFGRGGSDTTASILAAALKAEYIEIYSDVEGILSADPRQIPGARNIPETSYIEAVEMANKGANVIHPQAVSIADQYKIPIKLFSTSNNVKSTIIFEMKNDKPVTGITSKTNIILARIFPNKSNIHKTGLSIFQTLAQQNISVDFIDITPELISFIIEEDLEDKFIKIIRNNNYVFEIEKEFSKISVVGSGMTGMPGIMAKIVKALSSKDIMIYECTDSYTTISCLVKSIEEIKAITALHKEFKLGSK
ncbi:MAG: aspartate kinase [Candidatus Cloacimonetes bacterium]|nr:aspartate kinase [Candidatus Cloacimonadota bacterium]